MLTCHYSKPDAGRAGWSGCRHTQRHPVSRNAHLFPSLSLLRVTQVGTASPLSCILRCQRRVSCLMMMITQGKLTVWQGFSMPTLCQFLKHYPMWSQLCSHLSTRLKLIHQGILKSYALLYLASLLFLCFLLVFTVTFHGFIESCCMYFGFLYSDIPG